MARGVVCPLSFSQQRDMPVPRLGNHTTQASENGGGTVSQTPGPWLLRACVQVQGMALSMFAVSS